MSNEFDFGLDDLIGDEQDTTRRLVTGAAWLVGLLFLLFSAITTYQYFALYAWRVGAFVQNDDLAPVVAGLIGVLMLDVGAFIWQAMRSWHASTRDQMAIALTASAVDFVLSLSTSVLFVVLSSAFDVGVYDVEGQLTRMGQGLQYAGVAVVTMALINNFGALYFYQARANATKVATQRTNMRALVQAGRHRADEARARQVVQQTLQAILDDLPAEALAAALANKRQYITSTRRREFPLPQGSDERPALPDGDAWQGMDDAAKLAAMRTSLGDATRPTNGRGD